MVISQYTTPTASTPTPWMEQLSTQASSTQSILRACLGWVLDLGLNPQMNYYQKKNLALINAVAFSSLLLAMPLTFVLILMGFGHPFALLLALVVTACLVLALNGARRVEASKALFSFAPGLLLLAYTLLELSKQSLGQPLNYLLIRQGLCFALLIPLLMYGFDSWVKATKVGVSCALLLMVFEVGSMRLGAFPEEPISGASHGLFSLLSLVQFAGLGGCLVYMQAIVVQHAQQAQEASEKLKRMAIHDGLTGVFNHAFIEQLVGDAINRSKRSGNPLSLLMIDVDSFKHINDTLGHNAGDEILVRLAHLLNINKRSTDYLGRWGGDELVLLLTDTSLDGAANLAEKLRNLVETQAFPHGKRLTLSLGASEYQLGDTPASLVARADAAMYQAKRAGRNRVCIQSVSSSQTEKISQLVY